MKLFWFSILFFFSVTNVWSEDDDESFRVGRVIGQVRLAVRGNAELIYLKSNQLIPQKSSLVTGSNSFVDLIFPDGSIIAISENTRFRIDNLHSAKEVNTGTLALVYGKLLSSFKKIEKPRQIEFITPYAIAGVRGTTFALGVETNGESKLLVSEGVVVFGNQTVPTGNVAKSIKEGVKPPEKTASSDLKTFEASIPGGFTALSVRLAETKPTEAYEKLSSEKNTSKESAETFLLKPVTASAQNLDPKLKLFIADASIQGDLKLASSPSVLPLARAWINQFAAGHKNIHLLLNTSGEAAAKNKPADGLSDQTVDARASLETKSFETYLADASEIYLSHRPLTEAQKKIAEKKIAAPLVEIQIGLNALALVAHKNNPLKGLSVQQLNGIYSENFSLNHYPIISWRVLTAEPSLQYQSIFAVKPMFPLDVMKWCEASFLSNDVLKSSVVQLENSSRVINSVSSIPAALSFVEIAALNDPKVSVNVVPVLSAKAWVGDRDTFGTNQNYPYSFPLSLYLKPTSLNSKAVKELLFFILSREGQFVLGREGYLPLNAKTAEQNLLLIP
jgi:phosphate transport system substrate-binding protein